MACRPRNCSRSWVEMPKNPKGRVHCIGTSAPRLQSSMGILQNFLLARIATPAPHFGIFRR